MKLRSLKNMAFLFAMATMIVSGAAFANRSHHHSNHHHSNRHHKCSHSHSDLPFSPKKIKILIERVEEPIRIIFNALNNIFNFVGNNPNPDPTTNPELEGFITTKLAVIDNQAIRLGEVLVNQLGVDSVVAGVIVSDFIKFSVEAISYSIAVNLNNLNLPLPLGNPGEVALAAAMVSDASKLGQAFFALTGDPQLVGLFEGLAINSTELVQAYRGVLDDANPFNAQPADPATEGAAATVILVRIQKDIDRIAFLIVNGLTARANEDAGKHRSSSKCSR